MKFSIKKQNVLVLIIIALVVIPKTRVQLQILMHKGLSYINPSTILPENERIAVDLKQWQLLSDENKMLNLSDRANEVIVLNFWATWCPPCIAEMPSLQKLYTDYNDKVTFLFITTDNFERVEKFKTKHNFDFVVYNTVTKIPDALRTGSIPRTFILNKASDIVVDESGAVDWNSQTVRDQLDALILE